SPGGSANHATAEQCQTSAVCSGCGDCTRRAAGKLASVILDFVSQLGCDDDQSCLPRPTRREAPPCNRHHPASLRPSTTESFTTYSAGASIMASTSMS